MIYHEPIPLLEAFHFFRAQKFGFSLKDYLDNLIKRHPTHEKEYDEYFVHLFAVYEALAGATVDDEMTDVLFGPLSTKGRRASNRGRGDCIAELLIEEVSVFCREDPFAVIRGRPENVLWQRIAAAVCGDAEEDKLDNGDAEDLGCYNTVESVLRMINGSKLSRRSKLDLIDLTLTRDKYIDAFEAALTSAARTFSENRALWLPLISVFADSYSNEGGEEKILDELLHFSDERVKDIVIYPSVVSFSSYYIDVDAESGLCSVDLGVLYRHFVEISRQQFNSAAEVSRIMSYLGDQTKFNIFSEIAKKPAYGRELAKRVGLAPCTVSQYLTSLNGTGLLDSHAVGKKIIYSVNRQRVDSFIAELQKILHGETERRDFTARKRSTPVQNFRKAPS